MKTYWLVGKKGVGGEVPQSFMSFVGGSHPIAIGAQNEDGISNSTLANINLKLQENAIPEEDDSINWPAEEEEEEKDDEIINPQKDSPVAYYGHVPHTPQCANGGIRFHWEKVWKFNSVVLFIRWTV